MVNTQRIVDNATKLAECKAFLTAITGTFVKEDRVGLYVDRADGENVAEIDFNDRSGGTNLRDDLVALVTKRMAVLEANIVKAATK